MMIRRCHIGWGEGIRLDYMEVVRYKVKYKGN